MGDDDLQYLLTVYKTLADESRLKILGVLATRECSVEELAAILKLREPTISHHLGKLRRELNLVQMRSEGTTHLYRLNETALRGLQRSGPTRERLASLADDLEGEAWERKVLRDFFEGERLKEIPARQKKRLVVLRWLATRFEPERDYPEADVNAILNRHHPDAAALRRDMVDFGLMSRDHGIYRRRGAGSGERGAGSGE